VIRVAIADDHRVVRVGLEQLLGTFDDVELVGSADGGEAAVELCTSAKPDVALLDLSMPEVDGIEVTRRLASASPDTRVVLFTSFSDREQILQALDAGAIGYLLKDAEPEAIHEALRAASRGEAPLAPKAAAALLASRSERSAGGVELTARERDVLDLLMRGLSNPEISERLVISEATAKTHVAHILQKLGLRDRVQVVIYAYEGGLVTPGSTGT
jgi:DNA-binding NarL/FixJ family response regulator